YDGDPLSAHLGEHGLRLLRQSIADLGHSEELRELGTAVFIDRPLGAFKAPAEPDQTLLLSYEAFSRSVAERRLRQLAQDPTLSPCGGAVEAARQALKDGLAVRGLTLDAVGTERRPVVSLGDARKAADDFLLLRTLPGGVREFLRQYDLGPLRERVPLDYLTAGEPVLLVRGIARPGGLPVLAVYDAELRKR